MLNDSPAPITVGTEPSYAPTCRAKMLREKPGRPTDFAVCLTPKPSTCQFVHDFGYGIRICRHPLHQEIVTQTVTADQTAQSTTTAVA